MGQLIKDYFDDSKDGKNIIGVGLLVTHKPFSSPSSSWMVLAIIYLGQIIWVIEKNQRRNKAPFHKRPDCE